MKAMTQRGREMNEEGKIRRKEMMRKMLDEVKKDKEDLVQKREDLKR